MDMHTHLPSVPKSSVERFKFSGNASEFFGIWFVNHTLTWLTLGIYSAWAKVRTLQYFYGNTSLAGGHFMFTAKPLAILRGRIIAFLLFVLYFVSDSLATSLAGMVVAAFIIAWVLFAPVLIIMVMSFRARYSEWRGIKFRFRRNFKEGYFVYLLPTLLQGLIIGSLFLPFNSKQVDEFFGIEPYQSEAASEEADSYETNDQPTEIDPAHVEDEAYLTERGDTESHYTHSEESDYYQNGDTYSEDDDVDEGYVNPYWFIPFGVFCLAFIVALPYFDFLNQRFFCRNLFIGNAPFVYHARPREYYKAYTWWLVAAVAFTAVWDGYFAFELNVLFIPLIVLSILFIPATQAYFKSVRYNLMLNHSKIDNKHSLISNVRFPSLFWVLLSNSFMVAITFGFMTAWAKVRTARYLLTRTALEVNGSLDEFVAEQQAETNALGEEVADMFDLEVIG